MKLKQVNKCRECLYYHDKNNTCQSKNVQLMDMDMLTGRINGFANHIKENINNENISGT